MDDGWVRLELTADYGENPMIGSMKEARDGLSGLMRWGAVGEDGEVAFEELPEVRFEVRTRLDPTIPLPTSDEQLLADHQLLTGIWDWKPASDQVQLQMTKGTPLDVLLWTDSSSLKKGSMKWAVLIAGDRSPVIHLRSVRNQPRWIGWIAPGGILLLGLVAWRLRRGRS